ncbi:MAG: O-antigen ligase family protein [Prevotellaceae bacterium]|jgi:O-antigen ligase|nr:O-antigen ligase family protein [Prevotellaceae bacterium]
MGIGVLLSVIYPKIFFSYHYAKIFKVVYGILLLNFFYQFTFGWLSVRLDDWMYLLAKFSTSVILIFAIIKKTEFYISKAYIWLACLLTGLFLNGWIFATVDPLTGRYTFGFGNANWTGYLGSFAFAVFLIKTDINKYIRYVGLCIALIVVVVSGSRMSLFILCFSFLFKYKISFKLILGYIAILFVLLYLPTKLGIEARAVERFADNSINSFFEGRKDVQRAGFKMFLDKFVEGYGLSGYKFVDIRYFSVDDNEIALGTHNGYLAAAKMYGIFGVLFFVGLIFSRTFLFLKKYFKSSNPDIKLHLFVVCAVLVNAMTEDYLVGVNAIGTVLFFTSISSLEYIYYQEKLKRDSLL